MKTAVLFLAACISASASWPAPRLAFYHTTTAAQSWAYANIEARLNGWEISTISGASHSMAPYLHGGDLVLLEPYTGQPLKAGEVVSYYMSAEYPRVLHMVCDVNTRAVYITGTNNHWSDGWVPLWRVRFICRRVVTSMR